MSRDLLKERADRLGVWLSAVLEEEFSWDGRDCSGRPADWIATETGRDVAMPPYRSKREALAIVARAGGLVKAWEPFAASAGLVRTARPQVGDVAVLALEAGETGSVVGEMGIFFVWGENGTSVLQPRADDILACWTFS